MNKVFTDLNISIRSFAEAHQLIIKDKFWLYLLVPGIVNLVLFLVSIKYFLSGSEFLTDWTLDLLGLNNISEGFLGALKNVLYWTLFVIMRLLFIMLYLSIYKYIVLIVLAPVLAWVSEKAEQKINGKDYPFNMLQFIKDIIRGVMIAIRNLFIEMAFFIVLWIMGFVPVVGLLAPIIMFCVQSYFYGFSMMDYYNERRKMKVKDSVRMIYKHKGIAIGNGAIFYALFLLPVVGWVISPIYSVIAATISLEKVAENKELVLNQNELNK